MRTKKCPRSGIFHILESIVLYGWLFFISRKEEIYDHPKEKGGSPMPNHVMNVLTLRGEPEQLLQLMESVKYDRLGAGSVDFNKIIPMPETLDIEAGSRTDRGLKFYRAFVEVYTLGGTCNMDRLAMIPKESEEIFLRQRADIPVDEWELGKTAWNNLQRYGAPTWYEWCTQHWGTKWNSYGYDEGARGDADCGLRFQTAWSAPHPVLQKLTEQFLNVEIAHRWADEDLGRNCGQRIYYGGSCIEAYYPEAYAEGLSFAAELWEIDPEEAFAEDNQDVIDGGMEY